MGTRRPTLADVAGAAGVSVSTASLAFSGAGPITPATRQKVLDAAAALSYVGPNPLGRQLRSGRSGIVGVVVGDALARAFRDPVSVQFLDGLVSTLGPLGLGVLLIPASEGEGAPAVDPLLESAAMDVAVLLSGSLLEEPPRRTLERRGVPLVVLEGEPPARGTIVSVTDRQGYAEMTADVVALGHRRVAVVTLPMRGDRREGPVDAEREASATWPVTRRRLAGVRDAGVEPVAVWEAPASLVEHGRTAGHALLDRPDRPTAVLAQSDLLASGVLLAARELGLRVPEDVSVAGIDGIDLPWLAPDVLRSVVQPLADKGRAVGEAAARILDGEDPEPVVLPTTQRLGTTTGRAPG
ncbi:LacI family DNA-binding transcriptional regulator [Cellulomonas marina]|uniref:DNA-binding transcriptional regulator, LacI/PurR family n=1 Tax=Cellulomonas marina TaxID=988821 RepID=A0A1I0XL41_9CELL|nr:LacI family DNA-binding transcriptional regulator [Cellulomonas marina]GIG30119.1 transcriptional regulator [Cellulomonas marina]SFB01604.1 DNA-binding transcriptional regulator, LacI/PurR family [Cellulomonas marina]